MATPGFHITLDCEGRTEIARSPRDGGGFSAVIYMKHEGEMLPVLTLTGRQDEGKLSLTVSSDRDHVHRVVTTP
jgi:hypothetical protein